MLNLHSIFCDLLTNVLSIATLYNDLTDDDTDEGAYETGGFDFVHLTMGIRYAYIIEMFTTCPNLHFCIHVDV